eukprot:RCo055259
MKVFIPSDVSDVSQLAAREAYRATLESFAPVILKLPVDADGTFTVNVPFCGFFGEAPLLYAFLLNQLWPARRADIKKIIVRGYDVDMDGLTKARDILLSQVPSNPDLVFELLHADLGEVTLSPASLCLAMHPELNNFPAKWVPIIHNLVQSSPLVISTMYTEVETVQLTKVLIRTGICSYIAGRNPRGIAITATTDSGDSVDAAAWGWVVVSWKTNNPPCPGIEALVKASPAVSPPPPPPAPKPAPAQPQTQQQPEPAQAPAAAPAPAQPQPPSSLPSAPQASPYIPYQPIPQVGVSSPSITPRFASSSTTTYGTSPAVSQAYPQAAVPSIATFSAHSSLPVSAYSSSVFLPAQPSLSTTPAPAYTTSTWRADAPQPYGSWGMLPAGHPLQL